MDDGTRLVVLLDPLGAGRATTGPAPIRQADGARGPTRRPRAPQPRGPQRHRAAVDPGLVALPVRTGEPAARVRPRGGDGLPPRPAGRLDRALGAGRDPDRARWSGTTARRDAVSRLSPAERLARYGPTTGDRVRLGDTDLWVRVEEDRQAPGDEPIWGYAKTIRPRATQGRPGPSELDAVVAGALVVDPVDRRRQGRHRHQGRPDRRRRAGRQPGDQRRHRAADRAAHRADHGLRPDRDAGRGRQPRPPDQPGAACPRRCPAASRRSSPPASRSRRGRWRGRSRPRRLAGQRRAPGQRPRRGRRLARGAARRRGRAASRSTRTTARTRS